MCGIVGIYNHPEAANLAYLTLHALQHRGQESAGIAVSDGKTIRNYRRMGLVSEIFTEDALTKLPGDKAIGHVRYSTSGESLLKNSQRFCVNYTHGDLAIAHNGNLVNAQKIRSRLETQGSIFQSTMDAEVISHLMAGSREKALVNILVDALHQVEGAYSLVLLTESCLVAARDPYGWRPLGFGKLDNFYIVASERCV